MNWSIVLALLLIAAGIFVIYAIFISKDRTVQAWGNLIIGIIFIWFAYEAFIMSYTLFHEPNKIEIL